jgi:hypothetical protein
MANTPNSVKQIVTAGTTTLYTVPASTTTTVHDILIVNDTNGNAVVSMEGGTSGAEVKILPDTTVLDKGTLERRSVAYNLLTTEVLKITTDTTVHVSISFLDRT